MRNFAPVSLTGGQYSRSVSCGGIAQSRAEAAKRRLRTEYRAPKEPRYQPVLITHGVNPSTPDIRVGASL